MSVQSAQPPIDVNRFRRLLAECTGPLSGATQGVPASPPDAFMVDLGTALRYLLLLNRDHFTGQVSLILDFKDGGIALIRKSETTKLTA